MNHTHAASSLVAVASLSAGLALGACSDGIPELTPPDTGADTRADADAGGGSDTTEPCVAPRVVCGGACVDLLSNDGFCGTCDTACGARESCVGGDCVCVDGRSRCGAECVDTAADTSNCGGCGVRCGEGEVCDRGTCAVRCGDALAACAGACVDTTTSLDHCGECGVPCVGAEGQTARCADGVCVRTCETGRYNLDASPDCEYACVPRNPSADDVCDGEDNDCDGLVDAADPGYRPVACSLQAGVCAGAVTRCVEGALVACDAAVYDGVAAPLVFEASVETRCDGVDNNCSGVADETCCTPAQLPIATSTPPVPDGWDTWTELAVHPVQRAEQPSAVVRALATVGGASRTVTALVTWPETGGYGRPVVIWNDAFDAPARRILGAVADGDAVAVLSRLPSGALERARVRADGSVAEAVELDVNAVAGGTFYDARVRALEEGGELLLIAVSDTGFDTAARARLVELRGGAIVRASSDLTLDADGLVLLDAVRLGETSVACVEVPSFAPQAVTCVTVDRTLAAPAQSRHEGRASSLPGARFLPAPGGGHALYFSSVDGEEVARLSLGADGVLTSARTALRTLDAAVVSGTMPGGGTGLLTLVEDALSPGTTLVSLVLPDRAGASVATYRGTGAYPTALLASDSAAFVGMMTTSAEAGRIQALRLSPEGAALCIEEAP